MGGGRGIHAWVVFHLLLYHHMEFSFSASSWNAAQEGLCLLLFSSSNAGLCSLRRGLETVPLVSIRLFDRTWSGQSKPLEEFKAERHLIQREQGWGTKVGKLGSMGFMETLHPNSGSYNSDVDNSGGMTGAAGKVPCLSPAWAIMAYPKPHTGFISEPNKRSRQQRPMVSRHVAAVTHRLYDRLPSMGTFWAFSLCTHFLPYLQFQQQHWAMA